MEVGIVSWALKNCVIAELLNYTVYYTGKVDRVRNRVFDLNLSEMCLKCVCAENWDYTVYHTDNPNRVLNRVFALKVRNENLAEQLHYTASYTGYLDRVPSRVRFWKNLGELWITRLITRVIQIVSNLVSPLWTVRRDYTGRHTVCTNRVQDRVLY